MEKIELLKKVRLFSDLASASLAELSRISIRKKLENGEILFSEGDEASAFYVMDEGGIDLVKFSPDGRSQLVRQVRKGDIFAEAAMFSGIAFPVTAMATADSSVVRIDKRSFLSFIKSHPDVTLKMMGVMSGLLRHLNSLLAELSLGSVSQRLAAYLLKRVKTDGKSFELGISKRELAFKLGTIPETLSRNLKKMSSDGLISVAGKSVIVKDIRMLKNLISS